MFVYKYRVLNLIPFKHKTTTLLNPHLYAILKKVISREAMIKIKENIEDFIVSEVAEIFPEGKGEYSLYLLKKYNVSTWDALGKIAKLIRIPMDSIGFGGLKDKKAIAQQFITIKNGPKKDIETKEFELIYLGQTTKPMSKDLLLGNRFEIRVKNFPVEPKRLDQEVKLIQTYGIANYFDEQRFGSVKTSKEFAAKEIIKGNYEKALYLMLAEASPSEIEKTRKLRDCLKKHWRDFKRCIEFAHLSWEKNLLKFLSEHKPSKRTFKRALNLVDREYLFFLGNAYQSYIWNEILKEILQELGLNHFKAPYLLGEFFFYREVNEDQWKILKNLKLPLPSPKLRLELNNSPFDLRRFYDKVCQKEGFTDLTQLRSFIKGMVFKTYPRPAVIFPENLVWEKLNDQEIKLIFFLEKGSYATLVVKRLFYGCAHS